jgi:hypothetical protein
MHHRTGTESRTNVANQPPVVRGSVGIPPRERVGVRRELRSDGLEWTRGLTYFVSAVLARRDDQIVDWIPIDACERRVMRLPLQRAHARNRCM